MCHFPGCGRQRMWGDLCGSHVKQKNRGEPLRPVERDAKYVAAVRPPDCKFPGCVDGARGPRGLCPGHDGQLKRGEELHAKRGMTIQKGKICSYPGCKRPCKTNNLCATHYLQYFKTGELHPINQVFPCALPGCNRTYTRRSFSMFCKEHVSLAKQYGLSIEQMVTLWGDDPHCEVCGARGKALHIDHDHSCCPGGNGAKCGKCVRGLLCLQCNHMLGNARDDVAILASAMNYLERTGLSLAIAA